MRPINQTVRIQGYLDESQWREEHLRPKDLVGEEVVVEAPILLGQPLVERLVDPALDHTDPAVVALDEGPPGVGRSPDPTCHGGEAIQPLEHGLPQVQDPQALERLLLEVIRRPQIMQLQGQVQVRQLVHCFLPGHRGRHYRRHFHPFQGCFQVPGHLGSSTDQKGVTNWGWGV
ncbi:hypothetical protein ACLOJK_026361 [Asimina triloba]